MQLRSIHNTHTGTAATCPTTHVLINLSRTQTTSAIACHWDAAIKSINCSDGLIQAGNVLPGKKANCAQQLLPAYMLPLR